MPTILIQIGQRPDAASDYPVGLFTDAVAPPAGKEWYQVPVEMGSILARGPAGNPASPGGAILAPMAVIQSFAGPPRPARAVVQQIGDDLFRLFDAGFAAKWAGLHATGGLVRTILDVQPDELAGLPWEALREPGSGQWLFHQPDQTLTHGPIDFAGVAAPMRGLLRALIVLGSPTTATDIHVGDELEGLQLAFRQVHPCLDWEVLDRPTQQELQAKLNAYEPDVLHFIGHGAIARGSAILRFEGSPKGGPAWDWDAATIRATFGGMARPPRLAYFSACFGAVTVGASSWSLVRAVFGPRPKGTVAAVTMQAGIFGPAASLFANEFYRKMANRAPLDLAAAAARNKLIATLGLTNPDWAVPRLHLRVPPDRVFPPTWGLSDALTRRFLIDVEAATSPSLSYYGRTLVNVDRREQRRVLVVELEEFARPPAAPPSRRPNLMVIKGARDVGKTDLAIGTLTCALALGYRAVYVDLSRPGKSLDFHAILGRIKEGSNEVEMMDRLPPALFGPFDQLPHPADARDEHAISSLVEAFLGAMKPFAATAPGPAILALDQLTGPGGVGVVPGEFQSLFLKHVLGPLARGDVPGLLVLLVATEDEYKDLGLSTLRQRIAPCQVGPFGHGEFPALAAEYCLYRGYNAEDRESAESIIRGVGRRLKERPWLPRQALKIIDDSFEL